MSIAPKVTGGEFLVAEPAGYWAARRPQTLSPTTMVSRGSKAGNAAVARNRSGAGLDVADHVTGNHRVSASMPSAWPRWRGAYKR
jgi:hypothetical protein